VRGWKRFEWMIKESRGRKWRAMFVFGPASPCGVGLRKVEAEE
jgi:hypothetical protein